MADAKKDAAPEGAKPGEGEAPKKNKKPLMLGGGAVALVAVGYMLSLMAVPKPVKHAELEGPFVVGLSKSDIQVNLAGEGNKRYLVMRLQAEYFAYDEAYVAGRLGVAVGHGGGEHGGEAPVEDPIYTAQLKNSLLKLGSTKTRDQVTDPVAIDIFLNDVREVVDPILFPIYTGDSHSPHEGDKASGVKVGDSASESDFRGLLHEHDLEIDNARKKIRLDDGPWVEYEGRERDLVINDKSGKKVYVNLTELKPEFSGKVPIGVPGRVRAIYRESLLVQ
ncbi:MAG: hypothetical protein IPJ19_05960 [Planctomycetes bacterium]|nr:hypothetical protein [Planctomycetota bacterium]